mgnify:CR=1 FL=1
MEKLNLLNYYSNDFFGNLKLLTSGEEIKDVYIKFDDSSIEKIKKILISHNVTKDTQELFAGTIFINKNDSLLFEKGQFGFVKSGNVYSVSSQNYNPVHFSAVLKTLVFYKNNPHTLYALNAYFDNLYIDINNSNVEIDGDNKFYENVKIMSILKW